MQIELTELELEHIISALALEADINIKEHSQEKSVNREYTGCYLDVAKDQIDIIKKLKQYKG